MDDAASFQACFIAITNRKALEADVSKGVTIERVDNSSNLKRVTVKFNDLKSGVEFTPPPKKRGTGGILFGDVTHVRKLPPRSAVHKKAGLGPFKHCLEVRSRSGVVWHLVVDTAMDLAAWHDLFVYQSAQHRATRSRAPMASFIRIKWATMRRQHPDTASFAEMVEVLTSSFGDIPAAVIEERFRASDRDNSIRLDFEEFFELFRSFCDYTELRPLFSSLTQNTTLGMSREEFTAFLCGQGDLGELSANSGSYAPPLIGNAHSQQFSSTSSTLTELHQSLSESTYANALFDSFRPSSGDHLDFAAFVEFMVSVQHNSALDPCHCRPADFMDLPLNNYFINSSHNTYLTGDQLRSASSTDQYRDVLLSGCRCVEIDCWNGPGGDPVVYHGYTATSKIRFEDVIHVIDEYAFALPPRAAAAQQAADDTSRHHWNPNLFPVILSLEVHTSDSQSSTMARMLRRILGRKLLLPEEVKSAEDLTPARLKGRVLVKWKADDSGDVDEKDTSGSGIRGDRAVASTPQKRASDELSACVTIGSFKTLSWGTDAASPTCVQSYVESAIDSFFANHPVEFAKQNTRMLSRVYPAGRRVNSSNYDPMLSWRLGAHMVALNFQTQDRYTAVNHGFFAHQNGGCGYVLKPPHLRDPSASAAALTDASCPYTLTIRILCGAHLGEAHAGRRDTLRRIRCWIHGRETEERSTSNVVASSFHSGWNETIPLTGMHYSIDVLCLRLLASQSGGDSTAFEVGQINAPVRVLRGGYRAMPLFHPKTGWAFDYATIVCHISITNV